MGEVFILSPNLIRDKSFKVRKLGPDPSSEVLFVVSDGLKGIRDENVKTAALNPDDRQSQFSISLKIFLKDFDLEPPKKAIDSVLKILGTEYVEFLTLALPETAVQTLGFGRTDSPENEEARIRLLRLWGFFERLVGIKVIKNLGISDVDTDVFKYLYNSAKIKPNSVQVNQTTCCVVPPELKAFAKDNDVTLLTHNDPPVIWKPPVDSVDLKDLNLCWIVRSLVHIKARGVLHDKRYAICLTKK